MKLMTSLSFYNLIEFYQHKHNARFDNISVNALRCMFDKGVDISKYADPKYSHQQLSEIYAGMCENLDVSLYDDDSFDAVQMWELRQGLKHGIDISVYSDANYSNVHMSYIRQCLEDGIDVTYLLDSNLDPYQVQIIDIGLRKKLGVSKYANSQLSLEEIKAIFKKLEKEQTKQYRNALLASSISFKTLIEEYESKHNTEISLRVLKQLYSQYVNGISLSDDDITASNSLPPRLKPWYEIM